MMTMAVCVSRDSHHPRPRPLDDGKKKKKKPSWSGETFAKSALIRRAGLCALNNPPPTRATYTTVGGVKLDGIERAQVQAGAGGEEEALRCDYETTPRRRKK